MLSLFFLARRVTDTPECQGRLSRWSARCFATFSMKMIKFQTCTLLESCLVMSFHGTQAEDSLGLSLSKSETLAKLNSIPLIWEKIYCQVNTYTHTLSTAHLSAGRELLVPRWTYSQARRIQTLLQNKMETDFGSERN